MSLVNKLFGFGGGSSSLPQSSPISNITDIMGRFEQFKKEYQGKDPNKMIDELVTSGKCTREQVEQARNFARSLGIR